MPYFIPETPPPEYQSNESVNINIEIESNGCKYVYHDGQCHNGVLDKSERKETTSVACNGSIEGVTLLSVNNDEPVNDHEVINDRLEVGTCKLKLPISEAKKDNKNCCQKIFWCAMKICCLIMLLYLFICSLDFLSSAFRLLGGKTAGSVFTKSKLLSNPITGLMIGILATVLVQSSSTSTSVTITMVASGILDVKTAIPIVMGANVGTSITNTLVSMGHMGDREQYKRAFAGATVHDMFNLASVFVLLPLEVLTGYLYRITELLLNNYDFESSTVQNYDFLKKLTKPVTSFVIELDKKVLEAIALGKEEYMDNSLIKNCKMYFFSSNFTLEGSNNITQNLNNASTECRMSVMARFGLSDTITGVILLIVSLVMLCVCLYLMVRLLHSMLQGNIAIVIKKTMNSDLPGYLAYLTGYLALIVGAVLTLLVQSSSVFTSALTPLVGLGVLELERVYPLTLGSNIGTTGTGLLAAFTASNDRLRPALQVSLCHLFFNLTGIIIFYVIPQMRIPIKLAKIMGEKTAKYRWFPMFYLVVLFVVFPGFVFTLACLGSLFVTIGIIILACLLLFITVVNVMQHSYLHYLPKCLHTWEFLPSFLHSLSPLDRAFMRISKFLKQLFQPFGVCKSKHIELSVIDRNGKDDATSQVDFYGGKIHSNAKI